MLNCLHSNSKLYCQADQIYQKRSPFILHQGSLEYKVVAGMENGLGWLRHHLILVSPLYDLKERYLEYSIELVMEEKATTDIDWIGQAFNMARILQ